MGISINKYCSNFQSIKCTVLEKIFAFEKYHDFETWVEPFEVIGNNAIR